MPFDLAVLIIGDQPREAAVEIVVELGAVTGERKAARDLIDELLAALAGQEGGEILEIDDARGDDGRAAERRLTAQRLDIGEARHRLFALARGAAPLAHDIGSDRRARANRGPDPRRTEQRTVRGGK